MIDFPSLTLFVVLPISKGVFKKHRKQLQTIPWEQKKQKKIFFKNCSIGKSNMFSQLFAFRKLETTLETVPKQTQLNEMCRSKARLQF